MKRVYIASPYTKGDVGMNVRVQMDAFASLMNKGFIPFAPLLLHFQHIVHPMSYEDCMEWDLAWLEACDCVLRLGGESKGADMEVERARELGKSVFFSIEDMLLYVKASKEAEL